MLAVARKEVDEWYFDSAASSHMTRTDEGFKKQEVSVNSVDTANNLKEGSIKVQGVVLVPDLATSLLSISKICKKGLTVVFTATECEVLDEVGAVIASGTEEDGLYRLNQRKTEN
ncbi:uncharacterized protein LOC129728884 [Wyeomyia smithii]|uniref:uncharacterized protein LOC129728884 n=1 Tax=Wyeomyia smithii TaxID=174621 RepID=UPI002467E6E8|nr:uncharacterized protein LOC129728884 [Wyeomyia smithii]